MENNSSNMKKVGGADANASDDTTHTIGIDYAKEQGQVFIPRYPKEAVEMMKAHDNKSLKTVDDLEQEARDNPERTYEDEIVSADEVRDEAIKWIKALTKNHHYWNGEDKLSPIQERYGESTVEWIKHFFNITDEDLK